MQGSPHFLLGVTSGAYFWLKKHLRLREILENKNQYHILPHTLDIKVAWTKMKELVRTMDVPICY